QSRYAEHILEHGQPPPSVFKFCKEHDLEERAFYDVFPGFPAVEAAIWADLVDRTRKVLEADPDFSGYPSQQKILAFFYTFLEQALDHRSFMLARFPGVKPLDRALGRMVCRYRDLAESWLQEGVESGEIAKRGRLNKTYQHALGFHLLLVIDFWLKDESSQFQRTDAYIEKTVRLVGELMRTQAADATVDLVRFLTGMRKS
ncbi:MAG: hypothetical protein AAF492_19705, partial [Verrucomicrobiota bacterium]